MSTIPDYRQAGNKQFWIDLAERAAWTFAQAFLAVLVASGWFTVEGVVDLSILEKAGIAGIGAVLSMVKSLIARHVGSPNTAATLPAKLETPKTL